MPNVCPSYAVQGSGSTYCTDLPGILLHAAGNSGKGRSRRARIDISIAKEYYLATVSVRCFATCARVLVMPTKRGKLVKTLRKFLEHYPPANFAPWKNPNNSMRKLIDKNVRGKLEANLEEVQHNIFRRHVEKFIRQNQ